MPFKRAFYDAFERRDAATMNAYYATNVAFTDPGSTRNVDDDLRARFGRCRFGCDRLDRVLCLHGDAQLRSQLRTLDSRNSRRSDHPSDGSFELWRWSVQAVGPIGVLLG